MAAKKSPTAPRKPRAKKRAEPKSKGLLPAECRLETTGELGGLAARIESHGGVVLSAYREPLGGLPTIRLIVDDFVGRVGSDTRISRFFKDSNVALVKERFTHLFCELSGGPCTYLGADMKNSHSGMGIGNADFDAVIDDMSATLNEHKVSGREKEEFLALLRPMRKDIVEKP